MKDRIIVRGARQHNLKGFDVEIPRRSFTVITGPSGSGKSSLAFDTIYAEGQRRYVESLSAYARQFLERMEKPLVDSIEGLSPAVAIEQKNPTKTSRSTVGTATEIYDYLRLLWARVGRSYCPVCGRELKPDSVQSARDALLTLPEGTRFSVAFPLRLSAKVTHEVVLENLRAQGFVRVAIEGETLHLDDVVARAIDLTKAKDLLVVVDRLAIGPDAGGRLPDALGTAFREGDGDAAVLFATTVPSPVAVATTRGLEAGQPVTRLNFTERYECPNDGTRLPAPTPQLFSFNNPRGACETCNGFGAMLEYDESLIVPNAERSLRDGAIDPWTKPRYEAERRKVVEFARKEGIPVDVPWRELTRPQQERILHGTSRGFVGAFPFMRSKEEKRYKQYIRVFLRQYQTAQECPTCHGTKLKPDALQVRVGGASIAEAAEMPVRPADRVARCADALRVRDAGRRARAAGGAGPRALPLRRGARLPVAQPRDAHALGRRGAAHRPRQLARRALVDTLYVLDEPSIGLHSRDMQRLLTLLHRLRDGGNTVLVVEHDPEAIEVADYMVELGPESGEKGGYVVFAGPMSRVSESPLTGAYISGARSIPMPEGAAQARAALAHALGGARAQSQGRRPDASRSAR